MVLAKVNIRNGTDILNLDKLIEQLQKMKDEGRQTAQGIHLILKPDFQGQYYEVVNIWTIPGFSLEDAFKNEGLQDYGIFMEQNGALSHEQNFKGVLAQG